MMPSEDVSEEVARVVIEQADNLFDVVIVDCPTHTGSALLPGHSAVRRWFMMSALIVPPSCGTMPSACCGFCERQSLLRVTPR
jgi:hypothetical protein